MAKENLTERAKNGRNGAQLVYVLDCIKGCSRATDEGIEFENDAQALQFFFDCFDKEFNYDENKRRFPCINVRIGEYLQGLPSCCNIDYWNDDMVKLGVSWGVLKSKDDRKAEKFIEDFFSVCGLRILQAAEKVGIDTNKYTVIPVKRR